MPSASKEMQLAIGFFSAICELLSFFRELNRRAFVPIADRYVARGSPADFTSANDHWAAVDQREEQNAI
jgi:hypothetical protein